MIISKQNGSGSAEWHGRIKRSRVIMIASAIILIGFYTGSFLYVRACEAMQNAKLARCKIEMQGIAIACLFYEENFGSSPASATNISWNALLGEIRSNVVYLDVPQKSLNPSKEYLDPWGNPYLVQSTLPAEVTIVSAGPNRNFGDRDDMRNDRRFSSPSPATSQ
jgi:hypothetical protein